MDKSTEDHKREHKRLFHNREVVFKLKNGELIEGTTVDVSLKGLYIVTAKEYSRSFEGGKGILKLTEGDPKDKSTIKGTVIRVAQGGVAIRLETKQAIFAHTLSEEIFLELQNKMKK